MGRQRFLHHYLPAHLASALVTGALVEFIFNVAPISINAIVREDPSGKNKVGASPRRFITASERMGRKSMIACWVATLAILGFTFFGFAFYAPLTYGTPGLDPNGVNARKWLNYDLHFAK